MSQKFCGNPAHLWWAREIKALREQAGLSMNEAARKAKLPYGTWKGVESGIHRPRIDILERMLDAFGYELEVMKP